MPDWQVEGLKVAFSDPNFYVKSFAFGSSEAEHIFASKGAAATILAPLLTKILTDQDNDEFIRMAAMQALTAMGVAALDQAPLVAQSLDDESVHIRRGTAEALSAAGSFPAAAPLSPL